MNTGQHIAARLGWQHLMHQFLMTIEASALRHAPVARLDLNRLMKILQRKRQRMKEPVVPLGDPFPDRMMREVAIVAHGHVPMTRVLPRVKMILHYVAVCASCRIVAQIAPPLAVAEGERPHPEQHADQDRRGKRQPSDQPDGMA